MHPRPKSCEGCQLHATATGFMPRAETHPGARLLLLGEALGQAEARSGKPFQGGAGLSMFSLLAQEGLAREDFLIENSLRCFPPGHLAKYPVGQKMAAVDHCRQYSDVTLRERQPKAVLALGGTALWRMSGGDWPNIDQRRGYFEKSEAYGCWVGATYHPAFLMRGHWNLAAAWLYDIRRALEVAKGGYTQAWPAVWEDPPAHDFIAWVNEIRPFLTPTSDLYLDIETPHKSQMGEDELAIWGEEAILRISFAFGSWPAVSVPWQPPYLEAINTLLRSDAVKWIWNKNFDQRKLAAAGSPLAGDVRDAMWSWHVLQPTLPKGLGYVAPFFYPNLPRWKHLAGDRPAFYSAIDSEVLRGINTAVQAQLRMHRLAAFHEEHILEVDRELQRMTERGMPIDQERQRAASIKLKTELERLRGLMEAVLPVEQRRYHPAKGYQRAPLEPAGLVEIVVDGKVKRCSACGLEAKKVHVSKKTLSGRGKTAIVNPCFGSAIVEGMEQVQRWAKLVPFAPSNTALKRYATAAGHEAIKATGKDLQEGEEKVTFDERSLKQLIRAYPGDKLYPLVLDYRSKEKLLGYVGSVQADGSIVGGFPTHADGRVHYVFNHGAYTFRISPQEPNISQQPRPEDEWSSLIRGCFVAEPGHVITELDFGSIEALLVGYFANSARYCRICRLDGHSFVGAHLAKRKGLWNEEPNESWSDQQLTELFDEFKRRFKPLRQVVKKANHACVTGDHEVLTPMGWRRFDELQSWEQVAQWAPSGEVTFVTPELHSYAYEGHMVNLFGRAHSVQMTPNHRVPYWSNGKLFTAAAEDLPKTARLFTNGCLDGPDQRDANWVRLAAAIQADGFIPYQGRVHFRLRRPRKILRLKSLLKEFKIPFVISIYKEGQSGKLTTTFKMKAAKVYKALELLTPDKRWNLEALLQLSLPNKQVLCDEVLLWDGSVKRGKNGTRYQYDTAIRGNAVAIQTIANLCGRQGLLRQDKKGIWSVSFNARRHARVEMGERHQQEFSGSVYCVTVPTSYFVVRHRDRISITGNSNYGISAKGLYLREPETFESVRAVEEIFSLLHRELFIEIPKWQWATLREAKSKKYLETPFGNKARFWRPLKWSKDKHTGQWAEKWGEQAEECLAFRPQSTAAGILKKAIVALRREAPEIAAFVRLPNHDALIAQVPEWLRDHAMSTMKKIMERPIAELPLPWDTTTCLSIPVDGKWSATTWATMKDWHLPTAATACAS